MPICNTQINITPLLWDWWPICDKIQPYNPTYIFCASQTQFKMGICHGDFGGPLIDLKPGIYILQKIRNYAKIKFKVEKLCHDIYFKFGQYYRYYINIRCLMISTDQADPSCFYFRISWILMERHWFYFFRSLHLVQGLKNNNVK